MSRRDYDNPAPLHLSAENAAPDAFSLSIDHDADLNAQDRKARTPLHRATNEGFVVSAEALGAQMISDVRQHEKRNCVELAATINHTNIEVK